MLFSIFMNNFVENTEDTSIRHRNIKQQMHRRSESSPEIYYGAKLEMKSNKDKYEIYV